MAYKYKSNVHNSPEVLAEEELTYWKNHACYFRDRYRALTAAIDERY